MNKKNVIKPELSDLFVFPVHVISNPRAYLDSATLLQAANLQQVFKADCFV